MGNLIGGVLFAAYAGLVVTLLWPVSQMLAVGVVVVAAALVVRHA